MVGCQNGNQYISKIEILLDLGHAQSNIKRKEVKRNEFCI